MGVLFCTLCLIGPIEKAVERGYVCLTTAGVVWGMKKVEGVMPGAG